MSHDRRASSGFAGMPVTHQNGSTPNRTYDLLSDLPVRIEGYDLEPLSYVSPTGASRYTTIFKLRGGDSVGLGEDICWSDEEQLHQLNVGAALDIAGDWTMRSFASHLSSLDLLYGRKPKFELYRNYRRWALESAALDLGLRQAKVPLHEVLGREPQPVRFVVSLRLGDPANATPVTERIDAYGAVKFKLDAGPNWGEDLVAELADLHAVDVIDFKGGYRGTEVDVETDPGLYRRCAEAFPTVYLEDPDLEAPGAKLALRGHHNRIS